MTKILRSVLAAVLMISGALATASVARADVSNSNATNAQEGDNRTTGNQNGTSKSGDAVGGQVTGVVSSGRTSVDAKNSSKNSDVTSGDAHASNTANSFTGLNQTEGSLSVGVGDISNSSADNLQEGDNRSTFSQSANATTGDGVAGEVIGAVTGAGGSTSIVAANTTTDSSVDTGDAHADNSLAAFTGLNDSESATAIVSDINDSCDFCDNVQEGDNRTTGRQSASSTTGDGVAGQVIGAVSSGATSIDASNTSDNVDVQTGDADSSNDGATFVGLNDTDSNTTIAADISNTCNDFCENLQEGDNRATYNQSATSTSGDGIAGEVIGVVTSAGGSASVVAANKSTNTDVDTGDATSSNDLSAFVGLNDTDSATSIGAAADVNNSCNGFCDNLQSGDNRLVGSQTATSSTGDGVGGQVLGVVSAGRASIDATNHTDDSDVSTGDSNATNSAAEFVGLNDAPTTTIGGTADINNAAADNLQDGDNRKTLSQSADATSGDAVAGQVSGVVTSAGGSASVVLDNTSTNIDATSGEGHFDNTDAGFVGHNAFGEVSLG